jgi:hypothetical protein
MYFHINDNLLIGGEHRERLRQQNRIFEKTDALELFGSRMNHCEV